MCMQTNRGCFHRFDSSRWYSVTFRPSGMGHPDKPKEVAESKTLLFVDVPLTMSRKPAVDSSARLPAVLPRHLQKCQTMMKRGISDEPPGTITWLYL
ncbi:hypothetical protein MRX96_015542 [Rhipicephalus microplus]